ncbi:MAG: hypothetical protein WCA46_11245 [Actinocatenispora sp.]
MNPLPTQRPTRLVAATCAAAMVAGAIATAVTPAAAAPARAVAPPAAVAAHRHPSRVVLPTGERLSLRWSGDTPTVGRRPGDRQPISTLRVGRHLYAVPPEAMPYIGSTVDRNLFDVTALAAKEGADGAGRIPVSLTFADIPVSVPGVRITSTSGRHASGHLDRSSAATFGAALRGRQNLDAKGARVAGTPIPGLTRLSLAVPATHTVRPHFPQVTLRVDLTPPEGRTVLGAIAMIVNTDDTRRYREIVGIDAENYAKVSVPKGHYDLVGSVVTQATDGTDGVVYFVPIVVDLAVTGDGQAVTLDATKATATTAFTTPRPADLHDVGMDIYPTDGRPEIAYVMGFGYEAEDQVYVQPTPKPKYGELRFDTYEYRSAAPAGGEAYDYHLTEEWLDGIPASLRRDLTAGDLTRVEDRFTAPGTGDVSLGRGPVYPDLRGAGLPASSPDSGIHVDYLYGPPDVRWTADASRDTASGTEGMFSAPVRYRPGRTYPVDWFRESLAPGVQDRVTFPRPYCLVCRTADGMSLSIDPETDSDPAHHGWLGSDENPGYQRFQVFQDGASIVDEQDTDAVTFPVPAEEHTYRIEDTVDRAKLGFTTGTRTSSVYSVRSSSTSGAAAPADWACDAPGADQGGCTVLPLLTANVPLPTSSDGAMPVGTARFVVRIGHVAAATSSAVTALTFGTSLDGATFSPAKVTDLGDGRYRVTLRTPSSAVGQHVSIRVHAEDATGGTLTQTVTDAYPVVAAS